MKVIATSVHGVLDYLVGIALILAPYLFGFEDDPASASVARMVGIAIVSYSLFSRYEWGVVKLIPMNVHLMLDMAGGAFLAVSPWLFGFNNAPANVWVPHVVVGLAAVVIALLSSSSPRDVRTHSAGVRPHVS
ncbi:MAG: SPW repeat protein [Bryobacteraceae bacterium]|nr:SPW repeat protein [Bryobacteraceae bacterium]